MDNITPSINSSFIKLESDEDTRMDMKNDFLNQPMEENKSKNQRYFNNISPEMKEINLDFNETTANVHLQSVNDNMNEKMKARKIIDKWVEELRQDQETSFSGSIQKDEVGFSENNENFSFIHADEMKKSHRKMKMEDVMKMESASIQKEHNYNDTDERVKKHNIQGNKLLDVTTNKELMRENNVIMEEEENKNHEEKSVIKPILYDKIEKNVQKNPVAWEKIESDLRRKIKHNSLVIGIIAFAFPKNPFSKVRHFTISTFQETVLKEPCTGHWINKVKCLVKTMKITDLYTQGYQQTKYLRQKLNFHGEKLNVRIYQLPTRNPEAICSTCKRMSCTIFKVKNFFKLFYHYNLPLKCYGSK